MGSVDVELMKRLVEILAKSPHKFIVSKGLLHDKYELADNMWGERSVPQTKVLPLVDLVITHGGNNTVTETFSFGKPMIVMPLFADQFDNAQRIHEKGFGIRLETYSFKEEELLTAIEKLLNDEVMKKRLAAASNRILNSDSLVKASELIEKLVK
jgi:UDP:flavonoid glycosyltransferase YjiC (YdhE family)